MSESSQIVKAVKKVLPSVVSVTVSKRLEFFESVLNFPMPIGFMKSKGILKNKKKIKMGGGSGFIVAKNGIILTNRHVLEDSNAEYVIVLQNGKKFKPEILARDIINDVAVLKIDAPEENLKPVQFGDSSKLELGETVIAIGNALGLFHNTVSTGVVSGLSREISAQSGITEKRTRLRGLIQTDAAINPGNSGGPLINIQGKAIGINAAMVAGAENIGFALPIISAKKDLEDLREFGRIRQPFFGVKYITVDRGALVVSGPDVFGSGRQAVVKGSPAAKAGIKEGDIILEIENKKITEKRLVDDILQDCEIGKKLPIKILRNNKEKMLEIILAEKQ